MKHSKTISIFVDALIIIFTYNVLHYLKFYNLTQNGSYFILFYVYVTIWMIISAYYQKFIYVYGKSFSNFLKTVVWSSMTSLFVITTIVSIIQITDISRLFLLQISFLPIMPEMIFGFLYIRYNKRNTIDSDSIFTLTDRSSLNLQIRWVLMGALTILFVYFLLIRFKTGEFYLYQWSERILLIIFASWIVSIILTQKYSLVKTNNIFYQITPYIKSGLVMLLIASIVFFFFRIEELSRFLLFGTILMVSGIEIIVFTIYYSLIKYEKDRLISSDTQAVSSSWEIEEDTFEYDLEKFELDKNIDIKSILDQISSLEDKDELIGFLDENLRDVNISFFSSSIFSTTSIENIEILRNRSKNLILNLHEINDIRYINKFLIEIHSKLVTNGYFVGIALPIDTSFNRIKKQMPRLLFSIYYPFHFLFTRIIPKLPRIGGIYFRITKGRNQAISKAEIFGRLNYCGYKVVANRIINEKLYYIAQKIKTKSIVTNPSYHPIVKLNRIGINGEIIQIHKFRTMHPYSEFIQKDIYEENELDISGKFMNDFRITSWGRVIRKFWLDELPQLYDWIQGRLNIVGVRAISEHYFGLYPKEHQNFRIRFKPGIIPPYYVDLPKSLEEIVESEKKYLLQKQKRPTRTDIKYAILAFYNIIFRGARSS